MIRHATISECGLFRYVLSRTWDPEGKHTVLFVLVNPSTADAEVDDHTVRKGVGFATRWGYGSMVFANLNAFRARHPKDMKAAADPVGPENDRFLLAEAERADKIVLAWGTHGSHRGRDEKVIQLLTAGHASKLYCLGRNKSGSPKHPLTLAYDTPLESWL
jgi:hypothetical protein